MAIPNKPDFSKIFGANASSALAFTDENYLRGWEYLGQQPPSYQLFNDLQFKTDIRLKWLADSIDDLIANSLKSTDLSTTIDAHNKSQSAHSNILSAIKAITGTSAYNIAPSKDITTIISLLGIGGIVAQNLETNGFVKFANGLTMQWGVIEKYDELNQGGADFKSDQPSKLFNIAFTTKALALVVSDMGYYKNNILYTGSTDVTGNVRGRIIDNSSFKVGLDYNVVGSHIVDIQWFAIGF